MMEASFFAKSFVDGARVNFTKILNGGDEGAKILEFVIELTKAISTMILEELSTFIIKMLSDFLSFIDNKINNFFVIR